jgi:hypothetical protein
MAPNGDSGSPAKPVWRAPKVEDLGNLRDFVRTGGANGKSGTDRDSESSSTHEAKDRER